jgi:hypothetical protein
MELRMAIQEAGTLLARSMPSSATSRLHGLQRLKSEVEGAFEFGLLGDGGASSACTAARSLRVNPQPRNSARSSWMWS